MHSIKSSGADLVLVGCLYPISRPVLLRGPECFFWVFFRQGVLRPLQSLDRPAMCPIIGCRLGGSIVILNSLVVFFPGFHALRGESFSWRVANVNVNKQCFHLTGSLNSRSDALSGLHRVFFQQFSPGGSCPPHYGAFSPGLAKLKDQARAWFFFGADSFLLKRLISPLGPSSYWLLAIAGCHPHCWCFQNVCYGSVRHSQLGALPILRSSHILSAISDFHKFSRRRRLH